MAQPALHHGINYIEFTTTDIALTKAFYEKVFGWNFQDWGPDYVSFTRTQSGVDGGFRRGSPVQKHIDSEPLVVIYSQNLEATQKSVELAGGKITVPAFEFPGGRRFHFSDGQGNELAVWSEKAAAAS